jgi:hypothetical protein
LSSHSEYYQEPVNPQIFKDMKSKIRDQYQTIEDTFNAKINITEPGKVVLNISGRNKNGRTVRVKVKMDDYFLKYLNRDIMTVAKEKVVSAANFKNEIIDQANKILA